MEHFPNFIALQGRRVVLSGSASAGDQVICLTPTAPDARPMAAFHAAGLPPQIIPGTSPVPTFALLEETA